MRCQWFMPTETGLRRLHHQDQIHFKLQFLRCTGGRCQDYQLLILPPTNTKDDVFRIDQFLNASVSFFLIFFLKEMFFLWRELSLVEWKMNSWTISQVLRLRSWGAIIKRNQETLEPGDGKKITKVSKELCKIFSIKFFYFYNFDQLLTK